MARLYTLLLDFHTGLNDIANLLRRDPALTSRMIRIANSPAFGSEGIGTIEEALQRVGFGEVYRLVGMAANASFSVHNLNCYGFSADLYRRHNLLTALVAEQLAPHACLDARSAYTVGLLRRIGQISLNHLGRAKIAPSAAFIRSPTGKLVEWEHQHFGIDHHEVTGVLLAEWKFPVPIVEAVRYSHGSKNQLSPLGQIIDLTDNIVHLAGFGLSRDVAGVELPAEKIKAMGLTLDVVNAAQESALAKFSAMEGVG